MYNFKDDNRLHEMHKLCCKQAEHSGDLKIRYGAVLVNQYDRVLGKGYNHTPPGYDCAQCPRVLDRSIKSGTQLERCFAVHAEQEAIADAAYNYAFGTDNDDTYILWILGLNVDGTPILLDEPQFTCSFCARIMWAFDINCVMVATKSGPARMSIEEVLASSFAHVEKYKNE